MLSIEKDQLASRADNQLQPDVTIIVVNYNTAHLLERFFAAIEAVRGNLSILYFRKHHGLAGVLAGVSLEILGDAMRACNALVRRRETDRAAAKHIWTQIRLLIATRLGTQATR